MNPQDLGSISNLEKQTGVKLVAKDANGNIVPLPNAQVPIPAFSQQQVVSVANMIATDDLPANSTFTCDVIGGPNPSVGPVTINFQTHNANGTQGFTEPVTVTITLDPSIPGPATQLVVTPGVIGPQ